MPRPDGAEGLSRRERSRIAEELSGQGHRLDHLLAASGLASSTYHYYAGGRHPARPTRPELRARVAEIFGRTANGCGHRQVAMCLRAEDGVTIADKTVLKMMREMGLRCAIRRRGAGRYVSYRGAVGSTFENLLARDFGAERPWEKMGTDVTQFRQPWGRAYLAPVLDFCTKEVVAWSVSEHPNLRQQHEMLGALEAKKPPGAHPVLQSDMGWQYQHRSYCRALERAGIVQSMSRKGNCYDNAATEQFFGHLKDEFFVGQEFADFGSFKAALDAYIAHWNTKRRQVGLGGLTPEEYRRKLEAAA